MLSVDRMVESTLTDYAGAGLSQLLHVASSDYVLKYVPSEWAQSYTKAGKQLKVSERPALTWGTGTYVAPIAHPLSTAFYGRCGIVAEAPDAPGWKVFDARDPSSQAAYINWVKAQPLFSHLILTIHSTLANHLMRNEFRKRFEIDCVVFRPDQRAHSYTNLSSDSWLLITDWNGVHGIETRYSMRLTNAKFTVLVDEDFNLLDKTGLPARAAKRKIEPATSAKMSQRGIDLPTARTSLEMLTNEVVRQYGNDGFVHVWIEP